MTPGGDIPTLRADRLALGDLRPGEATTTRAGEKLGDPIGHLHILHRNQLTLTLTPGHTTPLEVPQLARDSTDPGRS